MLTSGNPNAARPAASTPNAKGSAKGLADMVENLARVVRAARQTLTDELKGAGSQWTFLNLQLMDCSSALQKLPVPPKASLVRLDVIASRRDDPSINIVAERWRISAGSTADDPEALSASAVLLHAIYAQLRLSDLYSEAHLGSKSQYVVTCEVQTAELPSTAGWEKRSWTIPDGLSVQLWSNRLWRRDLAHPAVRSDPVPIQREGVEKAPPTPVVPPLGLGSAGTGGSLKSSFASPSLDPNLNTSFGVRTASHPTPPFIPASFPVASFGSSYGQSPGPGYATVPLPPAVDVGLANTLGPSQVTRGVEATPTFGFAPLVSDDAYASSPVSKRPPHDNFLALMADEGVDAVDDSADCSTFMLACDDCGLQRQRIDAHQYVSAMCDW